ncbi:MAG: hypothetical protein D3923_09255 [Candidatus Electrothrix sp. AR3]|nr:hypothetical protein [Candidatus Electrothrix sp. AR3]
MGIHLRRDSLQNQAIAQTVATCSSQGFYRIQRPQNPNFCPGLSGYPENPLSHYLNADKASENGRVLLIDEIDKADSSVPNGLLEVLVLRPKSSDMQSGNLKSMMTRLALNLFNAVKIRYIN